MKILTWLLGALMVLAVIYFGLQVVASETGEVVVLHSDDNGADAATRLWVVDYDGFQWLRSGGGSASGWLTRLQANPQVELERAGARRRYAARVEPDMGQRINQLMEEKYGWRDDIVALLAGSRDNPVAVKLTPAD